MSNNSETLVLVMKGGGIKGLAYVGALKELEKHYEFDWFVGTSAGAIAAALLAAGHTTTELEEILNKDFNEFFDARFYQLPINLISKKGLYPGETFRIWIGNLITKKLGSPTKVLMKELPKRATFYASSPGKKALVFDSRHPKSEDVPVSFAVRCSMAIPFIFIPQSQDGARVVDGGMQNNYPVEALIGDNPDIKFIGLYLGPEIYEEKKESWWLFSDLLSILFDTADLEALKKYREDTIIIDPRPISTLDFNLTNDEKDFLLKAGRASALKFLKSRQKANAEEVILAENEAQEARIKVQSIRNKRKRTRKLLLGLGILGIIFSVGAYIFLSKYYCFGDKNLGTVNTPANINGPKIILISTKKYEIPIGRESAPIDTPVEIWDLPHRDSLWVATDSNLRQFKGIAGLLNPSFNDCGIHTYPWCLLGGYKAVPPNQYIDPEAFLIYEFDRPALVEGLEIITAAWGIKKLDVWAGNSLETLGYLGEATTPCPTATNGVMVEMLSCWYEFPKQVSGQFLKIKVKETYQPDGEFGVYRIYPEANGKRFIP